MDGSNFGMDAERGLGPAAEILRSETSHSSSTEGDNYPIILPPSPPPIRVAATRGSPADDRLGTLRPIPYDPRKPNPLRMNHSEGSNPPWNLSRPMTASNSRVSTAVSPLSGQQRPRKYGTGKFLHVELVPQPSDDPSDPLNWPRWKKELNFYALLMTTALVGVMKTALISVNAPLAEHFSVPYAAVAALTGVPLIISAFAGLGGSVVASAVGKRPVYLVSMVLIFAGSVWSTQVGRSYAQCMGARVLQGLGWGAFDTLVLGSIQDTYFEHERSPKVALYEVVSVLTTWGAPLLGGAASQSRLGFVLQYDIINVFQTVSVLLLVLAAPETTFHRSPSGIRFQMPALPPGGYAHHAAGPARPFSPAAVRQYLSETVRPWTYAGAGAGRGNPWDSYLLLQAPRALFAPSGLLIMLVTLLPFSALWGLCSSLSLLLAAPELPALAPSAIGAVMAAPALVAAAVVVVFSFRTWWVRAFNEHHYPARLNAAVIASGTLLVFIGVLAFGLAASSSTTGALASSARAGDTGSGSSSSSSNQRPAVSLGALSFFLTLLAAGVYVLDALARPLIHRSSNFTNSNAAVVLRNAAHLASGVAFWRALVSGIFAVAIPASLAASSPGSSGVSTGLISSGGGGVLGGLRAAAVGLGTAQVVVGAAVAAVWWRYDEGIRRLDGRVMGSVSLEMKRKGSFFDLD